MAESYNMLAVFGLIAPGHAAAQARAAAERAIQIDPNLSEGHAAYAYALMWGGTGSARRESSKGPSNSAPDMPPHAAGMPNT